jgi:ribonucleoside-diphosphate reductase alpha chain
MKKHLTIEMFPKLLRNRTSTTIFFHRKPKTLIECYGDEFEEMYCKLEAQGKGRKTIKAQSLWFKILESQMETGTPYMCYKDHVNKKSKLNCCG